MTYKIIFAIIILIGLLLSYAYFIEPNDIRIENQKFFLECLKFDHDDKRLVQISDLHFTEKTGEDKINKIYDAVETARPYAVFITGDLVSNEQGIGPAVDLVGKISKKYPVYVVFGNWDYLRSTGYDIVQLKRDLEHAGADVLINRVVVMDMGREQINLIGLKDPFSSGPSINEDFERLVRKVNGDEKRCNVVLAHSPDISRLAAENNMDLVLVGHTHGGQVYIPFLTEKIIPTRPDGKGFIKGRYNLGQNKQTIMYVNRGMGTSMFPFRFLVPPEVTVITLKAKQ